MKELFENKRVPVLMSEHGKLLSGNANATLDFRCHQAIFSLLDSLEIQWTFRWLRRSHEFIKAADHLGRPEILEQVKLNGHLFQVLTRQFWSLVRPQIFNLFCQFSFLMPEHLFEFNLKKNETAFCLFPPNVKLENLKLCLAWFSQIDKPILVGFPLLRKELQNLLEKANLAEINKAQLAVSDNLIPNLRKYCPRYVKNHYYTFGLVLPQEHPLFFN